MKIMYPTIIIGIALTIVFVLDRSFTADLIFLVSVGIIVIDQRLKMIHNELKSK